MQMAANMPMLIMTDPPRDTRLRSLVNRAFTPRRVDALEGRIREIATQLIDDIVDRASCDLVADLTGPLPTITKAPARPHLRREVARPGGTCRRRHLRDTESSYSRSEPWTPYPEAG